MNVEEQTIPRSKSCTSTRIDRTGGRTGGAKRFAKFHREVSADASCDPDDPRDRLCFVADWCDSLAHRIATGDLVEATLGWAIYRANGNSSKFAVHLYSRAGEEPEETPLRQVDAALEIAWLRAGHPREWLDAPLPMFREEAERRGVVPISRAWVSEAFTSNRERGTIYPDTGQLIFPVPAPKVRDSPNFQERKGESPSDWEEFIERWKVRHSPEFSELEQARAARDVLNSTIKRLEKLQLSDYKAEKKAATPRTNRVPSLEDLETQKNNNSTPPVNSNRNHHRPAPAGEEDVVVVLNALSGFGTPTPDAAGRLVQECREARPDSPPSPEEVAEVVMVVARGINRGTTNPVGMLLRQVPKVIATRKPPPPVETEESRFAKNAADVLEHPERHDAETIEYWRNLAAGKGVPS